MTNSWDGVHIDEYDTGDYRVFAVFRNGRHWKRLLSRDGGEAPLWVERNRDGDYVPVSGQIVSWLDDIWQRSAEFPRVQRFPRFDRADEATR